MAVFQLTYRRIGLPEKDRTSSFLFRRQVVFQLTYRENLRYSTSLDSNQYAQECVVHSHIDPSQYSEGAHREYVDTPLVGQLLSDP